jgi:thiamine-phosphate pyrophosphorylase
MDANQPPWPREWLMTDERIGQRLWEAIDALPQGGGVVFRHYSLGRDERAILAARVADVCRLRGLMFAVAGDVELARRLGARLVHNPSSDPDGLPFSRSAHSLEEAEAAWEAGASLVILSPILATRSHPGQAAMSQNHARMIVGMSPVPVIALGGMDRARFADVQPQGFYGWAGIDAWVGAGRHRS